MQWCDSYLKFCNSYPSIEPALHLKGGDGASEAHIHERTGNYCHFTVHDAGDTGDDQKLKIMDDQSCMLLVHKFSWRQMF